MKIELKPELKGYKICTIKHLRDIRNYLDKYKGKVILCNKVQYDYYKKDYPLVKLYDKSLLDVRECNIYNDNMIYLNSSEIHNETMIDNLFESFNKSSYPKEIVLNQDSLECNNSEVTYLEILCDYHNVKYLSFSIL